MAEKKITPKQPKAESAKGETKAATRVTKKRVHRQTTKKLHKRTH